jgi:hypothetical protein
MQLYRGTGVVTPGRRRGEMIRYHFSSFLLHMKTLQYPLIIPASRPRNLVARHAQKSGSGSHESKKFSRKTKHRNKNFLSEDYCDQK